MNHIKTNEEYKIFKGRKRSKLADWDNTNAPMNKRDWNEPFFNKNKPAYLRKKREEDILDLLGIPHETWEWFQNNVKKRFTNMYNAKFDLFSERGNRGVDDSYYYRMIFNAREGNSDSIYIFPKEKKIVVQYESKSGNKFKMDKKIFQYDENTIRTVLSDVLDFLYTLKEDPSVIQRKRQEEYDLQRQRKYKELLYTDDELEEPEPDEDIQQAAPKEIPSHRKINRNAPDTAAFDSFNHVKSFQMFESGMPDTLKHYKRDGIMDKLKPIKKRLKKEYNKIAKNPLNRFDIPVLSQK